MASVTFTVEGSGVFPFDMLRYDACWPKTQDDTAAMERMTRRRNPRRTRVTLTSNAFAPTTARWESFGWTVVEPT